MAEIIKEDTNDQTNDPEKNEKNLADQVRSLILKKTDIQEDEIDELIEDLIEMYNGIVTETAALYLLAKEQGINPNQELGRNPEPDTELEIQNVVPGMDDLTIEVTVDQIQDTNTFEKDGETNQVRNVVVRDENGDRTQLTLWGDNTVIPDQLSPGDQLRIQGGYTSESDWCQKQYGCPAELRIGNNGALYVVDDDGDVIEELV